MNLLTSSDVAKKLGVTPQTVTHLARAGDLVSTRVGNRNLFDENGLDVFMEERNLSPAPDDHPRHTTDEQSVTAVSFFSGALGLDLGLEQAGIRAQLMCESDTRCRMTIDSNRPDVGLLGDINKVTPEDVYSYSGIEPNRGIDVMFGGPPCQAFSTAGARRAFDDARGNVFLKYLWLAEQLRPRYLIIENVRGLLSTAYPLHKGKQPVKGGALEIVLKHLDSMGYSVSFNLYNAANYGAPQIRERVVIIAKRDGGTVPWLKPTNSDDPSWGLPEWHTLGDAIEDVQGTQHYTQFPEKRLRYFRLLREGQYWRDLPEELQEEAMGKAYRLTGGKTGFYRRVTFGRPSPTLVTSPTMPATDLCHPTENRPLSVEEYEAIQGFPDDWAIRGCLTDMYRQIGNAVPVALGRAIGQAIIADMKSPIDAIAYPGFEAFPYSRYRRTSQLTWSCASEKVDQTSTETPIWRRSKAFFFPNLRARADKDIDSGSPRTLS
ncbi:MAG: DNA cytosine methyltransferase [Olsenella sp.]|jgi:DNA (cytosine-5)-methyltransferase 1|nr:DNA cytosine methyltransferase [Olsenella sp.]